MASAGTQNINDTNHEDFSDVMKIVEPEKTPWFSSLRKGKKPTNVYHEWPADSLADVRVQSVAEGHDPAEFLNKGVNRQRIGNFVTIMEEGWHVTDLQMLSNPAGVDDMAADGKAKAMSEWKRNCAARFGGDYELKEGTAGTNYESRGLGNWISNSAQSLRPVPSAYRTPAPSINTTATGSLAEADVNDVLTSVFQQGGNRVTGSVYANVNWKVGLSRFARQTTANLNYRINEDASTNKITRNVTVYEGDFGTVNVVPDLFIGYGGTDASRLARAYYSDSELVELNWMEALYHIQGLNPGGGPRGTWKGTCTLSVLNPLGFAKWAATS